MVSLREDWLIQYDRKKNISFLTWVLKKILCVFGESM